MGGRPVRHTFKVHQRIKRGVLRGTVLEVLKAQGFTTQYEVRMDNGAFVKGTGYQFVPVKRAQPCR